MICLLIAVGELPTDLLEQVLVNTGISVEFVVANNREALIKALARAPQLVFYAADQHQSRGKLLANTLAHYSSDSCLIRVTPNKWHKPMRTRQGIDVFTIATAAQTTLHHQMEFILHYAQLKQNFRQAKHLLSLAELRSQWLVENAQEAFAYIANNQHLYANAAYLTLMNIASSEEAQATHLSSLIPVADQKLVIPLSTQVERLALPSHRTIASFRPIGKAVLRCEIRLTPAVYRGQRCAQLQVTPIIQPQLLENEPENSANPWQKQNQALAIAQNEPQKSLLRLQLHETLNLHTATLPALYIANNLATTRQGQALQRNELLSLLADPRKRIELDHWNLQQIIQRLPTLNQKNPLATSPQILLELGTWFWKSAKLRTQLISQLSSSPLATQLILALRYADLVEYADTVKMAAPLIKASGLRFALMEVTFESIQLATYLKLFRVALIQLAPAIGATMAVERAVPNALNHLLLALKPHSIPLMVDGLVDIASMNRLSSSEVGYLYGPILERLSS
ncbi:hypothetical protein [Thiofilum flexile]|uniref:hypothetical protein n=1 Tax=Thiofilum flexile TaxID=125627 RepID=UPI00037026DA|nr:hypothetical protein [Thiofilum flexile]